MGWLTTTETLTQRTPLPPGTSLTAAIALLQNHDFFLRLDPEYVSHVQHPTPPLACSGRQPYGCSSEMDLGSTVTFEAVLTDIKNGTHWDIKGPTGYEQTTLWTIEEDEGKSGNLELVEKSTITAKRGISIMIKNKILGNSPGMHKKYLEELAKANQIAPVGA